MKTFVMIIGIVLFALAGCAQKNLNDEVPKQVQVEVITKPQNVKASEQIEIQALVTQGGKNVADADDVKFEIWKDSDEKHEMLEATNKGKGIYTVNTTFKENGLYHIIAHTNARDMHVMPEIQVTVGGVEAAHEDNQLSQHQDDHESHGNNVSIDVVDTERKVHVASRLTAHIQANQKPVTGAQVQFEIWTEGSNKHEYVPAKEESNGEYTAVHMFQAAGSYHVKVHVEKGQLHEHQEQVVEVKE